MPETQVITAKIRIFPTKSQKRLLKEHRQEYIAVINQLSLQAYILGKFPKTTTADVDAKLPSALINQAIRDARSAFGKYKKTGRLPEHKKPRYYVNNQNHGVRGSTVGFPIYKDGKSQKTWFRADITPKVQEQLHKAKPGMMKLICKNHKWYVQICLEKEIPESKGNKQEVMGVDLGLNVPAVAVTSTGKTKFLGNGRQNKYIRRQHKSKRRHLGKLKKLSAIRKRENKESRWMKDQNHKISRQIVNLALAEEVSAIKLERLTNIRQTASTSRKNEKNLHSWAFYQLQEFIKYKAALAGIEVQEVNPAYTSQQCPVCPKRNKPNRRLYKCSCGYQGHRDRVGAINIMHAA
ncbi:RNA-guided endonuclease InsQ/TnpB family protein [Dethiobacter alkaliphilus]|uniref:RNA-guided endonuclease InsQ/TnpB family protein n=1 Tax=Dethiobacter alkaliphilus TaxID=427926 RepID=UPI002226FC9D|nr:transposase [Dethiobacter alkaliphilus]MCW3490198.1 transposase [Dethiobacter alkaliphilus]